MVIQPNRSQVNWSTMGEYNDDLSGVTKSVIFDSSNPSDDIWRKFALPLTPPRSPRTFGETSDTNSTEDIADRLQDVCDSLDSAFEVHSSKTDSKSLRSKLISDCMWSGGSHNVEVQNRTKISITYPPQNPPKKLSIESEEDLYPTPCASPLPSVTSENVDYHPSSSDCVDPTSVFPLPHQENISCMLSSQSDTDDEEIDVVTVDSVMTLTSTTLAGSKRKHKQCSNNKSTIILAKIQNTCSTSIPPLKRTKSSPAKISFNNNTVSEKERQSRKFSSQDDSDPETRRATHNVLERKRRIDLKRSFERLRECVPNLEKIDKTPKVIVLKKASLHIEELNKECLQLEEQKRLLVEEKELLTQKLNSLLENNVDSLA